MAQTIGQFKFTRSGHGYERDGGTSSSDGYKFLTMSEGLSGADIMVVKDIIDGYANHAPGKGQPKNIKLGEWTAQVSRTENHEKRGLLGKKAEPVTVYSDARRFTTLHSGDVMSNMRSGNSEGNPFLTPETAKHKIMVVEGEGIPTVAFYVRPSVKKFNATREENNYSQRGGNFYMHAFVFPEGTTAEQVNVATLPFDKGKFEHEYYNNEREPLLPEITFEQLNTMRIGEKVEVVQPEQSDEQNDGQGKESRTYIVGAVQSGVAMEQLSTLLNRFESQFEKDEIPYKIVFAGNLINEELAENEDFQAFLKVAGEKINARGDGFEFITMGENENNDLMIDSKRTLAPTVNDKVRLFVDKNRNQIIYNRSNKGEKTSDDEGRGIPYHFGMNGEPSRFMGTKNGSNFGYIDTRENIPYSFTDSSGISNESGMVINESAGQRINPKGFYGDGSREQVGYVGDDGVEVADFVRELMEEMSPQEQASENGSEKTAMSSSENILEENAVEENTSGGNTAEENTFADEAGKSKAAESETTAKSFIEDDAVIKESEREKRAELVQKLSVSIARDTGLIVALEKQRGSDLVVDGLGSAAADEYRKQIDFEIEGMEWVRKHKSYIEQRLINDPEYTFAMANEHVEKASERFSTEYKSKFEIISQRTGAEKRPQTEQVKAQLVRAAPDKFKEESEVLDEIVLTYASNVSEKVKQDIVEEQIRNKEEIRRRHGVEERSV